MRLDLKGNLLLKLKKEKKVTYKKISESIGISTSMIQNFHGCGIHMNSISEIHAQKLSDFYGTKIEELFPSGEYKNTYTSWRSSPFCKKFLVKK